MATTTKNVYPTQLGADYRHFDGVDGALAGEKFTVGDLVFICAPGNCGRIDLKAAGLRCSTLTIQPKDGYDFKGYYQDNTQLPYIDGLNYDFITGDFMPLTILIKGCVLTSPVEGIVTAPTKTLNLTVRNCNLRIGPYTTSDCIGITLKAGTLNATILNNVLFVKAPSDLAGYAAAVADSSAGGTPILNLTFAYNIGLCDSKTNGLVDGLGVDSEGAAASLNLTVNNNIMCDVGYPGGGCYTKYGVGPMTVSSWNNNAATDGTATLFTGSGNLNNAPSLQPYVGPRY
jgi:hypothetical protein